MVDVLGFWGGALRLLAPAAGDEIDTLPFERYGFDRKDRVSLGLEEDEKMDHSRRRLLGFNMLCDRLSGFGSVPRPFK